MRTAKKAGLLMLILFLLPFSTALADDSEPTIDDYIIRLGFMVTTDNRMDGVFSANDLANLSSVVNEAFSNVLYDMEHNQNIYTYDQRYQQVDQQRINLLNKIKQKYDQKNRQFIMNVINTISQVAPTLDQNQVNQAVIHQVIRDGASSVNPNNPPTTTDPNIQTFNNYTHQAQISALAGTATIIHINNLQDDAAGMINAPLADVENNPENHSNILNNDNNQYDGSNNLEDSSSNSNSVSNSSGSEIDLRPVRFVNSGTETATIMVYQYSPPVGSSLPASSASTIVQPGVSNSSAMLDLPLGEYVFCYQWEIDEDVNGDGYIDFKHGLTSSFTLNHNHNDNPSLAVEVNFSAPASNPKTGRCFDEQQNPVNLTPEEQANAGTFSYSVVESSGNTDFSEQFNAITFNFGSGFVNITINGETNTFTKTGHNTYSYPGSDMEFSFIFTLQGFIYHYKAEWGYDGIDYAISDGTGIRN